MSIYICMFEHICTCVWTCRICAYVYIFGYVSMWMSLYMCACLYLHVYVYVQSVHMCGCRHVSTYLCVCVHMCICLCFAYLQNLLHSRALRLSFLREKKDLQQVSLNSPSQWKALPFPFSWQLMFQLHEPRVLHGHKVLYKVWLTTGTAELIQRHGQRVVHPREKTHEEKMKAWESEVTFVESQVIDPCLESDMGDRDTKKKEQQ